MAYGRREPSIFDTLTLSPLPYPVVLILLMVFLFLGISWFFSYEEFIEEAEEQFSWLLLLVPLALVLIIKWVSSIQRFEDTLIGGFIPYDRRQFSYYYNRPQEGSSPWGVAAVVVLLIVLAYFRSSIENMWGP